MRYPCLILDHDDTAVQSTEQIHYPAYLYTLEQLRPGAYDDLNTFKIVCGTPGLRNYYQEHYGFSDEEIEQEIGYWLSFVQDRIPDTYEGLPELLNTYREQGGQIYVVTHSDALLVRRDYEHHFGFLPDDIYDLHFPLQKPDPELVRLIADSAGCEVSRILVVDDLPPGLQMAREAGADFAYAGWCVPAEETDRYMRANSPLCPDSIGELAGLLLD